MLIFVHLFYFYFSFTHSSFAIFFSLPHVCSKKKKHACPQKLGIKKANVDLRTTTSAITLVILVGVFFCHVSTMCHLESFEMFSECHNFFDESESKKDIATNILKQYFSRKPHNKLSHPALLFISFLFFFSCTVKSCSRRAEKKYVVVKISTYIFTRTTICTL